ncbi:hypothetical protein JRG66_14615 [Salinimicrobium tongyeongense]|uniref:Uncharacterized protein n=1 Tax=Salinimicrobium tongyeongense TaxID=2809707 RepID=A0ABY6NR88_9FLAO|nr:hypothetical protein [Salinimicrobium tongyeongense]UZH55166.1 hypothetical protein JRG66_14615 [Salinimicrobium tongyeongense]
MTKKEEQPKNNREDMTRGKGNNYNSDITPEDKATLNNQSQDEKKGEYFKEREEPIDYAGADLDLPGEDDRKFNPTTNKPQYVEQERRPKESANSNDNIESQTNTVYKGEKAEKYRDPSNKTRKDSDK